jgi:hypothetical protein
MSGCSRVKGKNIEGDARIFVNSGNFNNNLFRRCPVTGETSDMVFKLTFFTMTPAFAMSDPMGTGIRYGMDVYTDPSRWRCASATGWIELTR